MEKKEFISNNNKKELPYMILDTSFFIKLTSLDLTKNKYYTTQYIVNEIRDPKARDFYQLNKNFIEIKNPSKESIKKGFKICPRIKRFNLFINSGFIRYGFSL